MHKNDGKPGPGYYSSKVDKIVPKVQDKMHNAFSTNVSYSQIHLIFAFSIYRLPDSVQHNLALDLCKDHLG